MRRLIYLVLPLLLAGFLGAPLVVEPPDFVPLQSMLEGYGEDCGDDALEGRAIVVLLDPARDFELVPRWSPGAGPRDVPCNRPQCRPPPQG
jgi:hypothetical protein